LEIKRVVETELPAVAAGSTKNDSSLHGGSQSGRKVIKVNGSVRPPWGAARNRCFLFGRGKSGTSANTNSKQPFRKLSTVLIFGVDLTKCKRIQDEVCVKTTGNRFSSRAVSNGSSARRAVKSRGEEGSNQCAWLTLIVSAASAAT
jgi:hypothetical protein